MPAAPPDIWSHFFLQATSNSSDDGSDSEVDAGQAERTELDDLDLGVRNEGDLVVKAANPWTKAKIAAGVREQRKAADCSWSLITSESTSSIHRRQTPAEPHTSSSDIAPTSSSSSVSETRPRLPARSGISREATALSKGAVQGKNGWWRPPASAARTLPPARNVKKTRPAASGGEEVEVGSSREIIDLTKDNAGGSGAKELLDRLRTHSTVARSLPSEKPHLPPLDLDDHDAVAEPSPGSAPSQSRGHQLESVPSTTHTHVHNNLHSQSPHPRDANPDPSSKPPIPSSANIASSSSLSSPSPSRCQSQSTADYTPSTLPPTSKATSSASRSAPDARLSLGGDLSHATTISLEATARVSTKPAQAKPSKRLNDVFGKISFDRIPKNAGPTSDYPILQGLESQKRLRPRRQTSDSHLVKRTKKVVDAGTSVLRTAKPVGQEKSRLSNHVKEESESSPFRLAAQAMEYLIPGPRSSVENAEPKIPRNESNDQPKRSFTPLRPSQPRLGGADDRHTPLETPATTVPLAYFHPSFGQASPPLSQRWATLPAPSSAFKPHQRGFGKYRLPAPVVMARSEREAYEPRLPPRHPQPAVVTHPPRSVKSSPERSSPVSSTSTGSGRKITLWRPNPPKATYSLSDDNKDVEPRGLKLVDRFGQSIMRHGAI